MRVGGSRCVVCPFSLSDGFPHFFELQGTELGRSLGELVIKQNAVNAFGFLSMAVRA